MQPRQGSSGGFEDVMRDMRANPTFAQREQNTSQHSIESIPSPAQPNPMTFQPPPLKHVRQSSLPDSLGYASLNRRASESDALLKTRKNVVGELDRYVF